jgi:hypothetical protein
MEVVEVLNGPWNVNLGHLKLHAGQLCDNVAEGLLDVAHRDFFFSFAAVRDEPDAVLVELDDSLHHAHGFMHRAGVVILGEGVLLQELVFDNLGGLSQLKNREYLP